VAITVRDNPTEHRYEVHDGDQLAGFSEYKLTQHQIAFTHTQVDPAFNGRGLARQLVTEELDDARRRGLAVLPFCPYVRKVIAAHPEQYLDLVPASDRERFDLPSGGDADGPNVRPIGDTEAGR
jgi:predicted GNAT family acetyltransferase